MAHSRQALRVAAIGAALALLALASFALLSDSAEAQQACDVGGVAVDCNAPQVVGEHRPFCAYTHWHGDLNGQPDPNPNGCGHGPVTMGGEPYIRIFASPVDLLIELGFSAGQALQMVEGGAATPFETSLFRFADDPNSPPTIDPLFGQVTGAGASFLTVGPEFNPDRILCDNSPDPLFGAPGDDRILILCDGTDTLVGGDYIVGHAQLGGPLPPADPLSQNFSFPMSFPGQPTWQALPAYPGDTWQGGSVIPYVTQEPGGTGVFNFNTSVVQPDGSLVNTPSGSIFVAGGDSMFVFVPADNFPGLTPDTVGDLGFGVAVHLHDGSFGACATCDSTVTAFPPVPRDGDGGLGLFTRPSNAWPVILTSIADEATATPGPASGTESTPTGSNAGPDTGGGIFQAADDGGGSSTTIIIGGIVVTIAVAGGATYAWTRRQDGTLIGVQTDGPGIGAPPGNGPDILISDPPPGGSGPATTTTTDTGPPPSTFAGDVAIDPELAKGLALSFPDPQSPTAPPPPPPAVTNREEADWQTALLRETEAQEHLQAEFKRLLDQANAAWAEYRSAVDRFRSRYTRMLSGSTEMQGLLATWAEVRGIAQKQDLAFAIVTLLWSGGALALKGARWLSGGRGAAQAADSASDASRAGAAVAEYSSETPSFWKLFDMLNAKKAAGTQRLAAEAGMDFAELMAAHGDDLDAVLPIVLEGAAKARGWVTMAPDAENLVSRLLVNGRGALGGRMASLAADDVATLQRWAQQPGFWEKLGKAAGMMDEVGWLGNTADLHRYISLLYSADDIAFLKKIAESGGDMTKLAELLGPAQRTAFASLNETLAGVVGNAPTFLAPGAAHTAAYNAWQSDPVSQLGDVSNFVDQFGITSEMGGLTQAIDRGEVLGTGVEGAKLLGGELWDLISSPFETYQEYKFTFEALDVYEDFLKNHSSDLTEMSSALNDGYRALERLNGTLQRAGLSGNNGPLHRRMQDLRDVLDGMKRQYDNGDAEWREKFGDQYRERKAHIEEKLRYMEGVEAQLEQIGERLPLMMDWLDSLRRPGGQMRSLTSFIDPEIGVRMISIQTYLDQSLSGAYRNPTAAPAAAPAASPSTGGTNEAPATATDEADPFEEMFGKTPPELDLEYEDDGIDEQWEEQMRQLEQQWAEFDALPEDYELDVDLTFDEPQ